MITDGPFRYYRQKFPDVTKVGFMYADVGGVRVNTNASRTPILHAGYDIIVDSGAQIVSPDYTPEIINMRNRGVQMLYLFAFEVNMHVRMIRNMRQQNYDPPIKGANIAFNTRFSQLNGGDGDGWENHQTHLLFLDPKERSRSDALGRFIDWNERVFPGAQLDLFPVSGWGRAALFVEAMQKIEGEITRDALVDAMYKVERFDGGGVESTVDPRTGLGDGCFNMAVHRGGHWVREFPTNKLFECAMGELLRF
jgi:hypothetical protein